MILAATILSACTAPEPTSPGTGVEPPGTLLMGDAERVAEPSTADLPALAADNGSFALTFLRTVHGLEPGNVALSPWSLQVVLAQVYAGADGEAEDAIRTTLGWTVPEPALHEAFDAALLAVDGHHDPAGDPPLQVTQTNQIFVTTGYPLGEAWLDTLSAYYGTGVQQLDFLSPGATEAINAWVAQQTGGHITDLVTEPTVTTSRMMLINALFFAASWHVPFQTSATADRPFQRVDGSTVQVPTMSGLVSVDGVQRDGWFLAELPFSDDGLVFSIVLPDAGRFEEIVAGLDWAELSGAIAVTEACRECELALPKFELKSVVPVEPALEALGFGPAFGGAYPGISDQLTLSGVGQQAFVSVGEQGVEAAAASVATFVDSGSLPPFGPVIVDRPFLWLIREASGPVLFAGLVTDPR